ncbi:MAG: hypothetical protein P1U61_02810 [Legionellaceae bacterium]|nr:hypothetical protein [Legionellaceae bacterium]
MQKNNKSMCLALTLCLIPFGAQALGKCKVAATTCEVEKMITERMLSAPQPDNAIPANIAVTSRIIGISNFVPEKKNGRSDYTGSATLTLEIYNGTNDTVDVTCSGAAPAYLKYYGYSGRQITSATNTQITPTPSAAETPPALSITAAASASAATSADTATTAVTSFSPSSLWGVSMIGSYLCTITPADTAYDETTILVPVTFDS